MQGVMWLNQTYSRPFNHIYEFYNFQPDIQGSDDVFEVRDVTALLDDEFSQPNSDILTAIFLSRVRLKSIPNSSGSCVLCILCTNF